MKVLIVFSLLFAIVYGGGQQYEYSYGVNDPSTGDIKEASETGDGASGVVQGHYSLVEPDGSVRTVRYTADRINGFNAEVTHSGKAAIHAAPAIHALPAAAIYHPALPALSGYAFH
ncbi:cuticle protein 19-like [Chrysoperla carnea]|uniref:cuticle protein 19-like n=1 Tax=Chrysoperla carnea TaxID=189513 RepID=UPI001D088DFB|nr:cuticle protein 19-like [Chrysoperla carnea]